MKLSGYSDLFQCPLFLLRKEKLEDITYTPPYSHLAQFYNVLWRPVAAESEYHSSVS